MPGIMGCAACRHSGADGGGRILEKGEQEGCYCGRIKRHNIMDII